MSLGIAIAQPSINQFPKEILIQILGFTDLATVGKVCSLSKFWQELIEDSKSQAQPWCSLLQSEKVVKLSHELLNVKTYGDKHLEVLLNSQFTFLEHAISTRLLRKYYQDMEKIAHEVCDNFAKPLFMSTALVVSGFVLHRFILGNTDMHSNANFVSLSVLIYFMFNFFIVFSSAVLSANNPEPRDFQNILKTYRSLGSDHPCKIYERLFAVTPFETRCSPREITNQVYSNKYLILRNLKKIELLNKILDSGEIT